MIIEDFVMLGKTVPEVSSDGRNMVCTAGYSLELRAPLRIYPMARHGSPSRWSVSRIPLERNVKDNRPESWKIKGDRSLGAHDHINDVITKLRDKVTPEEQKQIVKSLTVGSIKEANDRRLSLCVLLPSDVPVIDLERGENIEMEPMPDMFGHAPELPVRARFKWHPRVRFTDAAGHKHNLMLRDWGCYELMRKHGDQYALQFEETLNLSTAPPLFCGNLSNQRMAWLVISIFSGALHARPDVFDQQFSMFGEQQ